MHTISVAEAKSQDAELSSTLRELIEQWHWSDRLEYMAPGERQRGLAMAVRRCVFALAQLPDRIEIIGSR